jgi:hypothetical protein
MLWLLFWSVAVVSVSTDYFSLVKGRVFGGSTLSLVIEDSLEPQPDFTITAWVMPLRNDGEGLILTVSQLNLDFYRVITETSELVLYPTDIGITSPIVSSNTGVGLHQWAFTAIVMQKEEIKLCTAFFRGSLVCVSAAWVMPQYVFPVQVDIGSVSGTFNFELFDLRAYTRSLSTQDLSVLLASTVCHMACSTCWGPSSSSCSSYFNLLDMENPYPLRANESKQLKDLNDDLQLGRVVGYADFTVTFWAKRNVDLNTNSEQRVTLLMNCGEEDHYSVTLMNTALEKYVGIDFSGGLSGLVKADIVNGPLTFVSVSYSIVQQNVLVCTGATAGSLQCTSYALNIAICTDEVEVDLFSITTDSYGVELEVTDFRFYSASLLTQAQVEEVSKYAAQHCANFCEVCSDPFTCTQCHAGYYLFKGNCLKCHPQCASCADSRSYSCSSCRAGLYLPSDRSKECVSQCSIGYEQDASSKVCNKKAIYLIDYDFNSLAEDFSDKTNNLKHRMLKPGTTDPTKAYSRGLWFGGSSFMSLPPNTSKFALPSEFTISLWTRPLQGSAGTVVNLVVKARQNTADTGSYSFTLSVSPGEVALTSSSQVSLSVQGRSHVDEWTHLAFSIKLIDVTEACLAVNFNIRCIDLDAFDVAKASSILLGCKSEDLVDCFKGFVWNFRVHDQRLSQSLIQSQVVSKAYAVSTSLCSLYPLDLNRCISECQLSEFGAECEGCASSCSNGCRRATDCSLCEDNCEECSDYEKCLRCSKGFFLRDDDCQACQASCKACFTGDKCTECADTALVLLIDSVFSCVFTCPEGYYPQGRECLTCRPECRTCTNGNDCSACTDAYYTHYQLGSLQCLEKCPTNFIGFNGQCKPPCTSDSDDCFDCNQVCGTCKTCQECSVSASPVNGYCDCSNELVYPKDSCRTKVGYQLYDSTTIILRLLQKPVRRLIAADLNVDFNSRRRLQTTSWKLEPTDVDTVYHLNINQDFDNITLQVDSALTSIEGYPYSDLPFSSNPVGDSSSTAVPIAEEVFSPELISGTMTVLVGCISAVSGQTTSLLNMIMTIQLASYIPLANEFMPADLRKKLVGTNQIMNIPGFLDSLLEDNGLNDAYRSVKKYGFVRTSFIYNSYKELLIILTTATFLALTAILSLISKAVRGFFEKVKKALKKIQFKLSCFLCLDLLVKAAIQLRSSSTGTTQEGFGQFFSVLVFVYYVCYPIYLVFVYFRIRGTLFQENSDANLKFGFLVEGFAPSVRGVSYWLMFIVHRLLFVLFLIVPDDPQLQLTAIFVLNLIVIYRKVLLVAAVVRPMSLMMLNALFIIAEICLSLVMCMILINYNDEERVSTYTVLVCLASCACVFFTCHLIVAVVRAVKRIRDSRRRKRNEAQAASEKDEVSLIEISEESLQGKAARIEDSKPVALTGTSFKESNIRVSEDETRLEIRRHSSTHQANMEKGFGLSRDLKESSIREREDSIRKSNPVQAVPSKDEITVRESSKPSIRLSSKSVSRPSVISFDQTVASLKGSNTHQAEDKTGAGLSRHSPTLRPTLLNRSDLLRDLAWIESRREIQAESRKESSSLGKDGSRLDLESVVVRVQPEEDQAREGNEAQKVKQRELKKKF